jgi:hypothetical protein
VLSQLATHARSARSLQQTCEQAAAVEEPCPQHRFLLTLQQHLLACSSNCLQRAAGATAYILDCMSQLPAAYILDCMSQLPAAFCGFYSIFIKYMSHTARCGFMCSPVSWNQCVSLRAACTVAAQWQKPSSHLLDLQQVITYVITTVVRT